MQKFKNTKILINSGRMAACLPTLSISNYNYRDKTVFLISLKTCIQPFIAEVIQMYPDEVSSDTMKEGGVKSVTVNMYERNPETRQKCVAHYKPIYFICGFDFGKFYGKDFFGKIHVHHINESKDKNPDQTVQ